jgi:hypothetical protein
MDDRALRLVASLPGGGVAEMPLDRPEICIGRDAGCDLVLASQYVSRVHARVLRTDRGFVVEDLGSTNGIELNGARVLEATTLGPGDRLVIGNVTVNVLEANVDLFSTQRLPGGPVPPIVCDAATWDVWVRGRKLERRLSRQEFALVSALADGSGAVRSREELGRAVWPEGDFDLNMLHQLVHRLKEKLGPEAGQLVESVAGVGYRLAVR